MTTTGIWADVVSNVACDGLATVESVIPAGGDPHGYEPSLQERERMNNAALVVANGLDLEEGLADTLGAVADSGTVVFEFADGMETIPYSFDTGSGDAEDAHDDHDDHGHEDEGHDDHDDHDDHAHEDEGHDDHDAHDDHGHAHGAEDPHVWLDPHRVSEALPRLASALVEHAGLDADALDACTTAYQAQLYELDAEIADRVSSLPAASRKLVTNHEALAYFADRYGFEVIGTVIPNPSTMAQTNPAQLERLAQEIEQAGVKAVFAETTMSVDDVEALAARVGNVAVVTLYTGSLGPQGSGADTYVGMLRANADLIVDALS